jgi:hypothetical protein
VFSEDEAQQDVEAANRKQEKGRDERKIVDVMREDGRTDSKTTSADEIAAETDGGVGSQALHDTEWAQAKFGPKHREKPVEKRLRPPNLGEDERDNLENDQEPVENGPELASGLIRDCAVAKNEGKGSVHAKGTWNDAYAT